MLLSSEKQCDCSLTAVGWISVWERGRRVEGVLGDPSPLALIFLDSSWDGSPFDVGNQLITSRNWFEGLGNSLKALFSNSLYFDLRNFKATFQGISSKWKGLSLRPLTSCGPDFDPLILLSYHPYFADLFSFWALVISSVEKDDFRSNCSGSFILQSAYNLLIPSLDLNLKLPSLFPSLTLGKHHLE